MGSISSSTPVHFLQAFLTLLQPGGFLQWDNGDVHNAQPFRPSEVPCKWSGWVAPVVKEYRPEVDMPMKWLDMLPTLSEAEEMIDVKQLQRGPPNPERRRYWTDDEFGVMAEIASSLGAEKRVFEELEKGWKRREQEIALELRVTMGRKALN